MHFSIVVVAITAALASATPLTDRNAEPVHTLSKRSCFGSGESWGGKESDAKTNAQNACNGNLGGVTYSGNEQKSACYNLGGNLKVNFIIKRIRGDSKALDSAECYDGLRKEIEGCNMGGRTAYTNWEYTSDPNRGTC